MKAGKAWTYWESDDEREKSALKSNYFKRYGKKAGNRLFRRTGKSPKICREPKHLPG